MSLGVVRVMGVPRGCGALSAEAEDRRRDQACHAQDQKYERHREPDRLHAQDRRCLGVCNTETDKSMCGIVENSHRVRVALRRE